MLTWCTRILIHNCGRILGSREAPFAPRSHHPRQFIGLKAQRTCPGPGRSSVLSKKKILIPIRPCTAKMCYGGRSVAGFSHRFASETHAKAVFRQPHCSRHLPPQALHCVILTHLDSVLIRVEADFRSLTSPPPLPEPAPFTDVPSSRKQTHLPLPLSRTVTCPVLHKKPAQPPRCLHPPHARKNAKGALVLQPQTS